MLAPTPEQYRRLNEMAQAWKRRQADALETAPGYNPQLDVDALCFQVCPDDVAATAGRDYLVGALISPVSLSLVLFPAFATVAAPAEGERRAFALPSGRYPFVAEVLEAELWLWRCQLLDDLSDLETREEGSRLAQRLMDRVMNPEDAA
ncbi:[NiFe]-hydrogenase assembly chaperone HybE [Halomonas sp. MCCC 1A17488]|uniref:[NiFe]-hydrogenase assembly chaperone HybE n=1 Tax=unclassified Halomonas TaxID=2609666 RepID=UPI0018D22EEA|nr:MULTISPECIES: [NiFe]-hydrogenase assembly chaperone HybE [unclassified Halomonas]MCE8015079.1 [NiFe]-hydrogenase assembly chaperone HybE [Halomonas sp. MCCC 1A17488]MCG3238412.1 [NiFe]-hydrogenase assembly chaperone HybE [Halomonas sp. MCCC 1A17488]QPP47845.1 [NiFe]-hydrogenase assembly chaperone HybE [Halomonas sp. SS10-MC5]